MIESEEEVAEIINSYLYTKIEDIEKEKPLYDVDPTLKLKEKLQGKDLSFSFAHVTEEEVRKAIRSLKPKTSSRLDFVSPKIVKMAIDVICVPL